MPAKTSSNGTTITREALLKKGKPRYAVLDVPGFGRVGVREPSEFKRSHRIGQLFDSNGNVIEGQNARRRVHMLIDQLMADENTPLFSDADADELLELSGPRLDAIVLVITKFNGEGDSEKNGSAG